MSRVPKTVRHTVLFDLAALNRVEEIATDGDCSDVQRSSWFATLADSTEATEHAFALWDSRCTKPLADAYNALEQQLREGTGAGTASVGIRSQVHAALELNTSLCLLVTCRGTTAAKARACTCSTTQT